MIDVVSFSMRNYENNKVYEKSYQGDNRRWVKALTERGHYTENTDL